MQFREIEIGDMFVTDNTVAIKVKPIQPYLDEYKDGGYSNAVALSTSGLYTAGEEFQCEDDDVVGKVVY